MIKIQLTKIKIILTFLVILFITENAQAQQKDSVAKPKHKKIGLTKFLPLSPVQDYTGKFSERATVTGDWGGTRQKLYDSGFMFDVALTQTWQGVLAGGNSQEGEYYGLIDYGITLDLGKLGIWGKGLIILNAQTNFGNTDLLDHSGALSPVNFLQVYPEPGPSKTFLMEYYLLQAFGKKVVLIAGRLNATNFLDKSWFANNPRTQFMNLSMNNNAQLGGFLTFSTYGALLDYNINKHISLAGAFFDAAAAPGDFKVEGGIFNKWGAALDIGVSWNDKAKLNGTVHAAFIYANKDPAELDNPFLVKDAIKKALGGASLPSADGNSMMSITFNQYLWKPAKNAKSDKKDKKKEVKTAAYDFNERGFGVFARFGLAPEDRNIFSTMYSIGLGGRGLSDKRPYDRMGIGMYYLGESSDLSAQPGNFLSSETGFEAYYAFAITPSIQIGADIQYIDSAFTGVDDPFLGGLRLMAQF
jgi:porin